MYSQAELVKLCDQVETGTIKTELDPSGDALGGMMEPYSEPMVSREGHHDDFMSLLLKVLPFLAGGLYACDECTLVLQTVPHNVCHRME